MIKFIKSIYYESKTRKSIQNGEWEDALKYSDKAMKISPVDTSNWVNKGVALWKLEKSKEAIECFDFVIARFLNFQDESLYFEGDDEKNLKENFISALNNKGSVLSSIGKNNEAKKLHKMVLELDPNRKSAIQNLRLDLQRSNKKTSNENIFESVKQNLGSDTATNVIKNEIKSYDDILKKDPKNLNALINKGTALVEIDKFNESIDCYDKALKIDSKNIIALLNKAGTFGRMGNYEKAIKYFDEVLKLDPKNKGALNGKKLANSFKDKSGMVLINGNL